MKRRSEDRWPAQGERGSQSSWRKVDDKSVDCYRLIIAGVRARKCLLKLSFVCLLRNYGCLTTHNLSLKSQLRMCSWKNIA